MSEEHPNGLTKLGRLSVLLREDGVEPESMDARQLVEYLERLKVDMEAPRKRFAAILKKAKAQQSLERACARRLKAIEMAKKVLATGTETVRAKVQGMIEKLGQRDPDQALVYAREFEKATSEDLATLEQDLTLLEMEIQADEKANPGDPS
jgi:hypothetical protein